MAVTVYRYGAHYKWPIPDVLREQLRIAHDLREDLVTLQLDYEAAVKAVWSSYPSVAQTEAALEQAEQAAEQTANAVSLERSRQRTKRITGPLAQELTHARAAVRTARQARRDAIAAVRNEAKAKLTALQDDLRAAQKALYADHVQTRGLYWATYNDVLDHHKVAVRKVAADRAAGKPATLRHHRFDGTGTIAVQLQRGAGMPARTPAAIADAATGRWRNVLALPWTHPDTWDVMTRAEQRRAGRVNARMRCGPEWIEIPLQIHRMLPADADITGARLTVRRVAGRHEVSLSVTARIGDPEPVTDGPVVALHMGWLNDSGDTIVGHWRTTEALDIPVDLRAVMPTNPGSTTTGQIRMPSRVGDRIAAIEQIASERSVALNTMQAAFVAWLNEVGPVTHPTRDGEQITAADVARWRSPGRFASLALAWRGNPPAGGEEFAAILEDWRRVDRAAWERQEHGRAKVLGHWSDLVRQVACVISDQAGLLVIDNTSIRALARQESDLPNEVERQIARRRQHAAPGAVRAAVVAACVRDGVPVVTVESSGLSRRHAACGHENPADNRYLTRPVLCDGCGAKYDPDLSATVQMIERALTLHTPPAADLAAS